MRMRPFERRRGSSLLEILVLLGTTALMLGLCAALIQVLLRVDRAGRADYVEASEASRLALAFRADVRSAIVARPTENALELDGPDGPIARYRIEPGSVVRVRPGGGESGRRDAFRLPRLESAEGAFAIDDRDGRTFVSLTFAGPGDRVEAALGADRRFEPEKGGN